MRKVLSIIAIISGLIALFLTVPILYAHDAVPGMQPVKSLNDCPMPDGCEWRSKITIEVVDANGNENNTLTWYGPRMDFLSSSKHNYLLLEYIYGRRADGRQALQGVVDGLAQGFGLTRGQPVDVQDTGHVKGTVGDGVQDLRDQDHHGRFRKKEGHPSGGRHQK